MPTLGDVVEHGGLTYTLIDQPDVWRVDRHFKHYHPFFSQAKFHHARTMYVGYSGPVGSGKTRALVYQALQLAYQNPGTQGLLGAPTYRLLQDVTLRQFHEIVNEEKIPVTAHKADLMWTLDEVNTEIIFRACDEPTRLVGKNLSFYGVDELSYVRHEESWMRLEARLREPKANRLCGFAVWTPKGFDWVYNRFINPRTKLANYQAIQAKPNENRVVLAKRPDFYESMRLSYDPRFYKQEALGEYLSTFAGQVYYSYDALVNNREMRFDRRFPIVWSHDFNLNPLCSVIAQMIPLDLGMRHHQFRVLDEIVLPEAQTPQMVEEFIYRTRPMADQVPNGRIRVQVYGDPSGSSRSTSASSTDYEIMRQMFARFPEYEVSFHVSEAHPLVKDRTNAVNALLLSASGDRKLLIHPKCTELQLDLEQMQWMADINGNVTANLDKRNPKRSHISDALGYWIHAVAPLEAPSGYVQDYVF
jgi:phage terminase large subunit